MMNFVVLTHARHRDRGPEADASKGGHRAVVIPRAVLVVYQHKVKSGARKVVFNSDEMAAHLPMTGAMHEGTPPDRP